MNKIKLLHVQFTDVALKVNSFEKDVTNTLKSNVFTVTCLHNSEISNVFAIKFTIALKDKRKEFSLKVDATAHFETEKEFELEFLDSDFVKINAPAIAFPYIRTFISNLTLNSGYNPVFLPSYNFVEIAKQKSLRDAKLKELGN